MHGRGAMTRFRRGDKTRMNIIFLSRRRLLGEGARLSYGLIVPRMSRMRGGHFCFSIYRIAH